MGSKFKRRKEIHIYELNEINELINYAHTFKINMEKEQVQIMTNVKRSKYYQLDIKPTKIELSLYLPQNGYNTYVFMLDGSKPQYHINGLEAFSMLQRMSRKGVNDLTNSPLYNPDTEQFDLPTIGGLVYTNREYLNKRLEHVYCYDRRSAYGWALMQPVPDTKGTIDYYRNIKDGEIGFKREIDKYTNDIKLFAVFKPGEFAEFIFKAIESPFKRFVTHYYKLKETETDKDKRQYYKDMLNICTGYLRRKDPFLHSCVVCRIRYKQEEDIDENTLYCHSDSLCSLVERPDLEIGTEIGQYKIERYDEILAMTESGYQWNNELPKIRGKSKQWFMNRYPDGYDILRDTLPYIESNKYYFDNETYEIKEVVGYEED